MKGKLNDEVYYRIVAWEKDENERELIVKADTREEAFSQVDGAKTFLFPGEDTSNYHVTVSGFTFTANVGTKVPRYRITVRRSVDDEIKEKDEEWMDLGPKSYEWIQKAENEEVAKEKMCASLNEDGENSENYHIYADEMTLEECISEEERCLFEIVRNTYASSLNITVREYQNIYNELEKNSEIYYEALKYFCKLIRARHVFCKIENLPKMEIKEIEEIAKNLAKAQTKEEYDEIIERFKTDTQ